MENNTNNFTAYSITKTDKTNFGEKTLKAIRTDDAYFDIFIMQDLLILIL